MSKRSTYRSEQEDFEKYFGDGLSEQERHEMERHALEDGFEAEAMEGWDEVSVDTAKADLTDLRKQLQPQKRSFNWFAIAAAVALLVVASWVVLTNLNQRPEMLAQEKSEAAPPEEVLSNAKEVTPAPTVAEEVAEPESVEEELPEAIEENLEPELVTDLVASNESSEPDPEVPQNARTTAPILQAKSEVAEELVVADLDVSELEIVESETETPVQVLAAEGQDQDAVRFRNDEQVFSVASDDFFEIKSKDEWGFRQIQGNVLDEEGEIVSDARIVLDGTSILAVSDFNGKFEMAVPDSLVSPSLTFSSSGFNQLNYSITSSDTFDVVMARENQPNFRMAFLDTRAAQKRSRDVNLEKYDGNEGFAAATPEGGYKKFDKYLKRNTRIPREAKRQGIKGVVIISVRVGTTGELSDFEVIRGLGAGCDEEAIRVVKEGPLWTPAKSGGEAIEIRTEIEVKFN